MNYLKFSLITLVFVLPISSVYAQDYTSDDKLKKIESFVEKVMQDWEAPSVGLGIVKGDQVILAKGFGFRNLEEKLPADENTLYAIGSASKAFTALGVCQLADDDKLDLDKPIINYLPDFRM